MTYQRLFATLIAMIGWTALGMQLMLTLGLVVEQGRTVWVGLWLYLGYFTILTNMLVALTMTLVAMDLWYKNPDVSANYLTAVTLYIAIVGVIYYLLLSGRVPELSSLGWIADRAMHFLVPALTLVFWVVFVSKSGFTFKEPFLWMVYPLGYFVYAMARGSIDGWYPYFFIDAGAIGYAKAMLNAVLLSIGVLAAGFLLVFITRVFSNRDSSDPIKSRLAKD